MDLFRHFDVVRSVGPDNLCPAFREGGLDALGLREVYWKVMHNLAFLGLNLSLEGVRDLSGYLKHTALKPLLCGPYDL